MEAIIQLTTSNFPTRYLGLPLMMDRLKLSDYGALLMMLEKTLSRWRSSKLSYVRRLQLLNWAFNGRVNFWLLVTRLPNGMLHRIRSNGYNFLWNGRKRASWDMVTLTKEEGGLGIHDLDEAATIKEAMVLWENGRDP